MHSLCRPGALDRRRARRRGREKRAARAPGIAPL